MKMENKIKNYWKIVDNLVRRESRLHSGIRGAKKKIINKIKMAD